MGVTIGGVRLMLLLAVLATLSSAVGAPVDAHARGDREAREKRAVAAARDWARGRPGVISFALRTRGHLRGHATARQVPAASLLKTMMLAAYLRRPAVRRRPLRGWERRMLSPMIRSSDDAAAARTLGFVGNGELLALARASGMRDFRVHPSVWGMSTTSARDQAGLYWKLRRLLPDRHERFALRLLARIVPGQRWGVGRVRLPDGWRLHFKGGWGSGRGLVDHQAALLENGRRRVALCITTTSNGSHAAGKRTLRGVARRLLRSLRR